MQKLIRSLGLVAAGGVLMCTCLPAAAEDFAALSGVPAEELSDSEMAAVEGTGWYSIRSFQYSSSGYSYIKVTVNGETQTASGTGTQSVTITSGGVTVTATSGYTSTTSTVTY